MAVTDTCRCRVQSVGLLMKGASGRPALRGGGDSLLMPSTGVSRSRSWLGAAGTPHKVVTAAIRPDAEGGDDVSARRLHVVDGRGEGAVGSSSYRHLAYPHLGVHGTGAVDRFGAQLLDGAARDSLGVADHPRRQLHFDIAGLGVGFAFFFAQLEAGGEVGVGTRLGAGELDRNRLERVFLEFIRRSSRRSEGKRRQRYEGDREAEDLGGHHRLPFLPEPALRCFFFLTQTTLPFRFTFLLPLRHFFGGRGDRFPLLPEGGLAGGISAGGRGGVISGGHDAAEHWLEKPPPTRAS